ncbi:MAG: HAD family hydrolase, partial [Candidatus Omnitrophota bacterium]
MSQKYIFIDRDGVINKDPGGWTEYGYVTVPEDFYMVKGSVEAIKMFTDAGYKVIIISNQQGVGKGYFSEEDLKKVTRKMERVVEEGKGKITRVYYCTHTDEEDCDCRKPREGMFLKAKEELNIESFEGKFYIGDTERDIQAGRRVGLKTIFVLSGKNSAEDAKKF